MCSEFLKRPFFISSLLAAHNELQLDRAEFHHYVHAT